MTDNVDVHLCIIGDQPFKIFGLSLTEWQTRNWGRAGVEGAPGVVYAAAPWVLSSGLAAAVVSNPGKALVGASTAGQVLIAAHVEGEADEEAIKALIAAPTASDDDIRALGLEPKDAEALAGFYNKELRKREKPFAVDLENDGVRPAEQALFDSSYKGVTDFVTKYAWPIPAFHVVRWCAAKKISPNTVTTASLMFVLLAMYFFWQGDWALGFASAWIMTFLDTVDGKLARTTLTSSKWGNIYDHGIDLIHPPFWYFAWVKGMENTGVAIPEWMHTALLITLFGYVFGRAVEGVFMQTHGFHIHVWGKVDSFMRVYTARRNPNGFIMMMFCIFGAPVVGFAAVTAWTVICNTFHTVRLFQAGFTKKDLPLTSWMAA